MLIPTFRIKPREEGTISGYSRIEDVFDEYLYTEDGDVSYLAEIDCIEMERLENYEYDSLNDKVNRLIKDLPSNTIIHKQDIYYENENELLVKQERKINQKIINSLYDNKQDKKYLFHKSFLVLIFPKRIIRIHGLNYPSIGLGEKQEANPLKGIDKRREKYSKIATEFFEGLSKIEGLRVTTMDRKKIIDEHYKYMNLQFDLPGDALHRDIVTNETGMLCGEKKLNIITMTGQSKEVNDSVISYTEVDAPFIYPFTHYLQFPHILNQTIVKLDRNKFLKRLDTEKKLLGTKKGGKKGKSQEFKIKEDELIDFTQDLRENDKDAVKLGLNVMVWDHSEERREKRIKLVEEAFRAYPGMRYRVEGEDTTNLFFANMLGANAVNYEDNQLPVPVDVALPYFNWYKNFSSDEEGDLLCDRFKNLIKLNVFHGGKTFGIQLDNYNVVIIGPSGKGKSYTVGHFMLQRYERRERQMVIDNGGTYKNLIESITETKYIEYDLDNPIDANPFILPKNEKGDWLLVPDKLTYLKGFIKLMVKGGKVIDEQENVILNEIIRGYIEQHNKTKKENVPCLTEFYDYLIKAEKILDKNEHLQGSSEFFNYNAYKVGLYPYAHGEKKNLFNSKSNIALHDYMIVGFDFKKIIKSDEYLLIAMMVTELSMDMVRTYPNEKKYIYMDEAWSMLENVLGEWVETNQRTLRKEMGSMNTITQGIGEIVKSEIGKALLENADTVILLNHSGKSEETIVELAKTLGLTRMMVNMLMGMTIEKYMREIFVKQKDRARVFGIETSKYEHAVLTSNPKERNYLNDLKRYYGNIDTARQQFVEDFNL